MQHEILAACQCMHLLESLGVAMLDDEPRLVRFVEHLAGRNGGRVFSPDPQRLGEFVVSDYLRSRRGARAR